MTQPFITGSQLFGIPNQDSDVDLVMLLDDYYAWYLYEQATDITQMTKQSDEYRGAGYSLKFGKLNIILLPLSYYVLWKQCTEFCVKLMERRHRRLTKEESKLIFRAVIDRGEPIELMSKRLGFDVEKIGYAKSNT